MLPVEHFESALKQAMCIKYLILKGVTCGLPSRASKAPSGNALLADSNCTKSSAASDPSQQLASNHSEARPKPVASNSRVLTSAQPV